MRTCVRVHQGWLDATFRRAVATGNLLLIRGAAAELPTVNLADALTTLPVIAAKEPDLYERAACRWLGRLALERDVGLEELGVALAALHLIGDGSETAQAKLAQMAIRG